MADTTIHIEIDDSGSGTSPGPRSSSTGRSGTSAEDKIDQVIDRLSRGLLSGQEALDRAARIASQSSTIDQFRDKYGAGANPRASAQGKINDILAQRGESPVLRTAAELKEEKHGTTARNVRLQSQADAISRATSLAARGGGGSLGEAAGVARGLATSGLAGGGAAAAAAGPIGIALVAAAAAVDQFRDAVNRWVAKAKELAAFDGRLAASTAQAEVKKLQRDIDIAKMQGENLSKLTDRKSSIEDSFERILAPLENQLIGLADKILEPIEKWAKLAEEFPMEEFSVALGVFLKNNPLVLGLELLGKTADAISDLLGIEKRKDRSDGFNDLTAQLFSWQNLNVGGRPNMAGAEARQQRFVADAAGPIMRGE